MEYAINQPVWRSRMPLNFIVPLNNIPKNPKRVLPKFDPRKGVSATDHLISYLPLNLLNVEH